MYALGIDLGTTYTAAATWRDGHVEVASLGSRSAAIPSVVLRRDDDTFLVGDPANRRGLTEPDRLSREFKRRLGDTTPILLAGVPFSAESLMSRLLRSVVDDIAEREGGQPAAVCISHPANWGPYKTDLLRQAARLADMRQPLRLATEPEAAAIFYAHQQRVEPGATVAVYDLGGGTFDAAVLRKTDDGFDILGQPEGIERLGGIDFDAAVFAHVARALGDALSKLDEDDPSVLAAVARLRDECVQAKEALSTDTDTAIPVLLPNLSTEVRMTRAELEDMVRPALHDTVGALRRALDSAQVAPEQLHSVLLVGGSSRMPIVSQLVGAELGRPVAVDAHPKHAVAAGAAWAASALDPALENRVAPAASAASAPTPPTTTPTATTPRDTTPHQAAPSHAVAAETEPATLVRAPAAETEPAVGTAAVPVAPALAGPAETRTLPAAPPAPPPPRPSTAPRPRGRWLKLAGALAVVGLLAAGGVALALTGGEDDPAGEQAGDQVPADEQCTEEIQANPRWICLTGATFNADGQLVVEYEADWGGDIPDRSTGFHMHLYGSDGTNPPAEIMGSQVPLEQQGSWYIEDQDPAVIPANQVGTAIGDAPKVCARISDGTHDLVRDTQGGFATGNCTPITR